MQKYAGGTGLLNPCWWSLCMATKPLLSSTVASALSDPVQMQSLQEECILVGSITDCAAVCHLQGGVSVSQSCPQLAVTLSPEPKLCRACKVSSSLQGQCIPAAPLHRAAPGLLPPPDRAPQ